MLNATAKKTGRASTRRAILEAAVSLAAEVGAAHMTLDAVAARAGVSKGGLLYNFPNKTALLSALIEESVAESMTLITAKEKEGALTPAALIHNLFERRFAWACTATENRAAHGMLAAMAEQPALLEPIRRFQSELWEKMKALVPDPDPLWIAWCAAEGLLFAELFGVAPLSPEERDRLIARLMREVDRQLSAPASVAE